MKEYLVSTYARCQSGKPRLVIKFPALCLFIMRVARREFHFMLMSCELCVRVCVCVLFCGVQRVEVFPFSLIPSLLPVVTCIPRLYNPLDPYPYRRHTEFQTPDNMPDEDKLDSTLFNPPSKHGNRQHLQNSPVKCPSPFLVVRLSHLRHSPRRHYQPTAACYTATS